MLGAVAGDAGKSARAEFSAPSRRSAQSDDIQIHIGRIEVTAVAQPTPRSSGRVSAQSDEFRRVSRPTQSRGPMSNGLAISGVTAVLQYYLHALYAEPGSPFTSTVNVSAWRRTWCSKALNTRPRAGEPSKSVYASGDAQFRLAQCRPAVRRRGRQDAPDEPAAGPRSPLFADGLCLPIFGRQKRCWATR